MAKCSVSEDASETARLLARLGGSVFIPIYIRGNWERFPSYDKHWIEAIKLFLQAYAFERAGAPQSYKEGAVRALENCKDALNTEKASQKVWGEFLRVLGGISPNAGHNPLNPGREAPFDAVYFCKTHVVPDDQNLYLFSLRNIRTNKVWKAHASLQRIRGIGPKIASLFLRDIALANDVTDIGLHDRDLLQPIDVWLGRTAQLLTGRSLRNDEAGRQLTCLADEAGCSALCLNAGSWYFGSKVARTEQRLRVDLKNPQSFISALERHHKAVHGKAVKEQDGRLLKEAELLGAFLRALAGHTGRLSGVAGQHAAAKTAPKAKKPRRESLASHLNSLLVEGGNIEEIRDKVNAHADRMGVKKIMAGRVRAHAKWRSRKGAYTVEEDTSGFIRMVPAAGSDERGRK